MPLKPSCQTHITPLSHSHWQKERRWGLLFDCKLGCNPFFRWQCQRANSRVWIWLKCAFEICWL